MTKRIKHHNPKEPRKLFRQCHMSPSGKHQYTRHVDTDSGQTVLHCHYCGRIK